jgi:hypothetical protein
MPSPDPRAPGFVHVDLDGIWTLAGAYGYPDGDSFENDIVYERGVERLLQLFDGMKIRATFFIVGRDLELPAKRDAVARIAAAGHEIANHSYTHPLNLESLPLETIRDEIRRTNDAVESATGKRPAGFRAPGYGVGPRTLEACIGEGMLYDGSRLPTRWGPVLRWLAGRLRIRVQRELGAAARPVDDGDQYRTMKLTPDGAAVESENRWHPCALWPASGGGRRLALLSVAVSPRLTLPIHASIGILLGPERVRKAIRGLVERNRTICYLLHGMDAIGIEDVTGRLPSALNSNRGFRFTWTNGGDS